MKLIYFFIFCTLIAKATPEGPPKRGLKSIPVVDALIQRLETEEWADEACLAATLQILNGVKNDTLWATWIWDSMQPPVGVFYGTGLQLGNYDQCMNSLSPNRDLSTRYCLVEVKIREPKKTREFGPYDSADEYLNTLTPPSRSLNNLVFGACMPAVCSPSTFTKFYSHMLKLTYLPDAEQINVDPEDCQTAEEKPYPRKYYIYMSVIGALLLIAIASTIYTQTQFTNDTKENSTIDAIARSFCIARNWNDLFQVNSNEIRVLNGMKFISATVVVGCHQAFLSLVLPTLITNSVEVDVLFDNELGQGITHADLVVDTFFLISGLLLIRSLLGGRQKNLLVVLIKRYFRLIGPYAAATFYIMCVARYNGSGPFWPRANLNEESTCETNWWKNFFMLSNDMKTMCYGVAWYVNCDFHLAILTVLLFWTYRKHRQIGIAAFGAVSVVLIGQLAVVAYVKGVPLALFTNLNKIADIRNYEMMNEVYIRWHDRAGSYLVGVAMGALMTVYKPVDHRNALSKTTSYIVFLTSLYVMMKVTTINYWIPDSPVIMAIAVATNRMVWAMAVCGIIAVCEYGDVPIVSNFLGHSTFVPLSKLTYGIYMTHFFIIQRNIHGIRSAFKFDLFPAYISTLGTTIIACNTALIVYLLIEAPCINLSNIWLSERKENAKLNGVPTNGTIHGANEFTKQKAS